ncbi:Ribosome maturation factor RimP [Cynara cardunculus var. scolymus]|uniref:Ribosome maturation factor RimP n=1 Tax=Cynara cardunculus var. scolymus TaxID=59895 RepID=A0A103XB08_CYNCS|nr:Ribosome maturation factor RimP [Cynara cardunculus var. scolymus]
MKMCSICNHHTRLLAGSSSQTNPFIITKFSKIPFCSPYPLLSYSVNLISNKTLWCTVTAKREARSLLSPSIVEPVSEDEPYEEFVDDNDEEFDEDDAIQDEDADPRAGDGGGGGGVSLAGTTWDKEALTIAEQVSMSFDGELGIYAFKTERLNEAEAAGSIPDDISLEVSSPGLERVIRVPQDLDRFKDRPMYVKYTVKVDDATSSVERDGILRLESFDLETECCTWGLADVRVNREKAGKGRPLNKKQREWPLVTHFDSLLLVRIYADL